MKQLFFIFYYFFYQCYGFADKPKPVKNLYHVRNGRRKFVKISGELNVSKTLCLAKRISLSNDLLIYSSIPYSKKNTQNKTNQRIKILKPPPALNFQGEALRFRIKSYPLSALIVESIEDSIVKRAGRIDQLRSIRYPFFNINGSGDMGVGCPDFPTVLNIRGNLIRHRNASQTRGTPVKGMIVPFTINPSSSKKTVLEIPKGWAICNGHNGTPNLIDFFVKGGTETVSVSDIEQERSNVLAQKEYRHNHECPPQKLTLDLTVRHPKGIFGKTYQTTTHAARSSQRISHYFYGVKKQKFDNLINYDILSYGVYYPDLRAQYPWSNSNQASRSIMSQYVRNQLTPFVVMHYQSAKLNLFPEKCFSFGYAPLNHTHTFPSALVMTPEFSTKVSSSGQMAKSTTEFSEGTPPHVKMVYIIKL